MSIDENLNIGKSNIKILEGCVKYFVGGLFALKAYDYKLKGIDINSNIVDCVDRWQNYNDLEALNFIGGLPTKEELETILDNLKKKITSYQNEDIIKK